MEARELRPGNIVNKKFANFASNGYYYDWSYLHYNDFNNIEVFPENFQPIPITEEWLIRFGFVHLIDSKKILYLDRFYFNVSDLTSIDISISDQSDTVECKYVHQLQNLYFALTGEELTIKN